MTKKVRVGLIGAGFVGNIHARAYRRIRDLDVDIAAVPLAQAEELARRYGIDTAYDDYRRILERDDINLVDLSVPNHLHERFTIEAAQAGKHIVCEKPLTGYFGGPGAADPVGATAKALMLQEALRSADRMIEAAGANGIRLMYAENWLYCPAVQKALRLAEASGGTILEMRAQECHSGSHATYAKTWKYAGGGAAALRVGPAGEAGDVYYLHGDHLGSAVMLTDESGAVVGRAFYDAYGTAITNTIPLTLTNRLYEGRPFDATTELVYHGAGKYYDPQLGRRLQPDPVGGPPLLPQSLNRYTAPAAQSIVAHTPMGRFGHPEDLLGTLLWLLSDGASFVHGAVIPVDGGFSAFSGV